MWERKQENLGYTLKSVDAILYILHLKVDSIRTSEVEISLQHPQNSFSYLAESNDNLCHNILSGSSLPYMPIVLQVKNYVYQHQHDDRLVSKYWLAILEHFQVEIEPYIFWYRHELNHIAETKIIFINCLHLKYNINILLPAKS